VGTVPSRYRLTRIRLGRLVRSRWLFPVVVLGLVLSVAVITASRQPASAAASNGATEAISVVNGPSHATGSRYSNDPDINADGRYVSFTTTAALDPISPANSSGPFKQDIYVRDTVAQTTTYLSEGHGAIGDVESNGDSLTSSISASGRYVAFGTTAANIAGSTAGTVVICDRGEPTGSGFGGHCDYTSLSSFGTVERLPDLSADGTRLAMLRSSQARVVELAHDATSHAITGATESTPAAPATLSFNGLTLSNRVDTDVALSADGRYLVRVSQFHNDPPPAVPASAPPGHDPALRPVAIFVTTYVYAVFVNDLTTSATAQRFDLAPGGGFVGNDANAITNVAVSGDGNRIAFVEFRYDGSALDNVLYTVNRASSPNTVEIASRDVNNTVVSGSGPSFSTDGRYLAFATDAALTHNGVDDTNKTDTCNHSEPVINAYERPLRPGPPAGSAGPGPAGGAAVGAGPAGAAPAGFGRGARAPGHGMVLVADTGLSNCDVVVRDLVVDAQRAAAGLPRVPAELASPSIHTTCLAFNPAAPSTCEGNSNSFVPVLDSDGSAVAFASGATDLVSTTDANATTDVFRRLFLPSLTVTPVDFGSVGLDSESTALVPVTYTGFGPLRVASVTIGGTNAADFTLSGPDTCTGVALHEGDTCSVSVRFKPGELGDRVGTLTLTPTRGQPATGALTGFGLPPKVPGFQAVPDPLDFGVQPLFVPGTPKSVTVTNTGTAPLTVTGVALVGNAPTSFPSDYTITGNTCVGAPIAPAATCQVTLRFAPQAVGPRPSTLQFTDNAQPGPQTVALTGGGAPPTLVATPALAPPGAVSQVTGTGFPPGKVVELTLDGMPSRVLVTAGANGTFTVPLVILPHTAPGRRKLNATVLGVPNPIAVSIDYLVVPGSLQPPDFAERR
jgi:Tol biopolymer transport system component